MPCKFGSSSITRLLLEVGHALEIVFRGASLELVISGRKALDEHIRLTDYTSTQAHLLLLEGSIRLTANSLCNFRSDVMAKLVRVDNARSGIYSVFHTAKESGCLPDGDC